MKDCNESATNAALVEVMRRALGESGLPEDAVQLVPGVTHDSVKYLMTARGLVDVIRGLTQPTIGFCLGQQLLFETSVEDGGAELLGLIPGRVEAIVPAADRTVPHMGWSRLARRVDHPLLAGVEDDAWAYFVHGFVCPDGPATLARADYGTVVPAVVRNANRWGCQFHPERSARAGARILQNFLGLPA